MTANEVLRPEVITAAEITLGWLVVLGLTFKQRRVIRERDNNKCQFEKIVPGHKCNGEEHLEVNHIFPRKYLLGLGVDPDYPENLLSICQRSHRGDPSNGHHVEPIHPDIRDAMKNYHKDNQSISRAIEKQREAQKKRTVWWNSQYDRQQQVISAKNTQEMDRKKGGRKSWWPW